MSNCKLRPKKFYNTRFRIDGPFSLEIEDIGVVRDENPDMLEYSAYETYVYPRRGYNLY